MRDAPPWLALLGALAGSAAAWKLAEWLYRDFIRPRLDRFVRDSRLRSGQEDDAITLGILSRNGAAFDAHIMGALDREPDAVERVIAGALERTALEHGQFLREKIFAREIAETAAFRARIALSLDTLAAVASGMEGLSAAQLAQGRALQDVPKLSAAMEQVNASIHAFAGSVEHIATELGQLAIGQGEMRGSLEVVRAIVLRSHAPEGMEERRHDGSRRLEDAAAGALIRDIRTRTDTGDGTK